MWWICLEVCRLGFLDQLFEIQSAIKKLKGVILIDMFVLLVNTFRFFPNRFPTMAAIRIVHSPAPVDAPETDLHIWTVPVQSAMFTTPAKISDALAEFMGLPVGSEVARSEIIRCVVNYAKEHKLLVRHHINADEKLTALLNPEPTTQLTILNLQKYLRKHSTPRSHSAFQSWWTERGQPLWIGIHVDPSRSFQCETVYQLFADDAYKNLTVVVYSDVRWNDAEGEAPCGCMYSPCDYHRHGEGEVAVCGCSTEYSIMCPYHAELD